MQIPANWHANPSQYGQVVCKSGLQKALTVKIQDPWNMSLYRSNIPDHPHLQFAVHGGMTVDPGLEAFVFRALYPSL